MVAAIPLLPLFAALIVGLFSRRIGDALALFVTCLFMLVATAVALRLCFSVVVQDIEKVIVFAPWFDLGSISVAWSMRIDTLSAVMMAVVCVISTLVHIYSAGYMRGDASLPRFMAYLSLFTFFMLALVSADNLLQMFFGWEGVGLASYLLIGYWHQKESAARAGVKAFLVNRIGDFGFVLGICATYAMFDTLVFSEIFARVPDVLGREFSVFGWNIEAITAICLLFFMGAMGKSAQLGLHIWLPDAMEGPTPVSALIHAATMVTAGVFMLCRMSGLFEYSEDALSLIAYFGAATAFFAATVAVVQNDLKRVIAYSTCSQLGYMVLAVGLSAYGAAMFHLTTHAFFKALLFLAAGSLIHALSGEQDMRKMGGLRAMIPLTYLLFWVGVLALVGIPIFSGYYSKDIIIEAAWASHTVTGLVAFVLANLGVLLTACYSTRMLVMSFHRTPRFDEKVMRRVHESPPVMSIPLLLLACGAIGSGYLLKEWFVGSGSDAFWRGSLFVEEYHTALLDAHHAPRWVQALPLFLAVLGVALGLLCYQIFTTLPARLARFLRPLYRFLCEQWYIEALYRILFLKSTFALARLLWQGGDLKTIDAFGPDGISAVVRWLGGRFRLLQSGYVYHYVFAVLTGVVLLGAFAVARHL